MASWDQKLIYVDEKMNQNKRKFTGSYFTPMPIAETIGECVLFQWIKNQEKWKQALPWVMSLCDPSLPQPASLCEQKDELIETLTHLTVGDLAAGSGVFLLSWVHMIEKIYDAVYGTSINENHKKQVLETLLSGIYAVDIELESLNSFETSVMQRWGIEGKAHVIHSNALEDNIPDILPQFDIVLGNPPYIGEKNNRSAFDAIMHTRIYKERYQAKMDYYYFFIYRGFECLKSTGVMANLVTSYFRTADGASGLRKFVTDESQLTVVMDFENQSLFESAKGHHSTVMVLQHHEGKEQSVGVIKTQASQLKKQIQSFYKNEFNAHHYTIPSADLCTSNGYFSFEHPSLMALYHKISNQTHVCLSEMYDINQGIVSGFDRYKNAGNDQGVFVLTTDEANTYGIEKELLRPFYKNSHIMAYQGSYSNGQDLQIIYIASEINAFETLYPNTWKHLSRYREKLSQRRECLTGVRPWYALQWPRLASLFEGSKLVVPHRAPSNRFAWVEQPFYGSADIYYLSRKKDFPMAYEESVMLGLLNSKLFYYLLSMGGKRKGKLLELYATPLKKIPVSLGPKDAINRIARLSKSLMKMADDEILKEMPVWKAIEDELNQEIYKLYGLNEAEIEQIEDYNKLVMK